MTILYCVTIQNKGVDFLKTLYYITTEIYAYAPNFTPKSSPFANASLDWLLVWKLVSDHYAIVRCFHNYWSFGLVLIDPLKDTKCWYLDMDRCHSFAIADGNVSIVSFMVQNCWWWIGVDVRLCDVSDVGWLVPRGYK